MVILKCKVEMIRLTRIEALLDDKQQGNTVHLIRRHPEFIGSDNERELLLLMLQYLTLLSFKL